jgi:hypothetical protein
MTSASSLGVSKANDERNFVAEAEASRIVVILKALEVP